MIHNHQRWELILDLKEKETRNAQIEMGRALHREEYMHKKVQHTSQNVHEWLSLLTKKQTQGVAVQELRFMEEQIHRLRSRLDNEQKQWSLMHKQTRLKQKKLSSTMKEEQKWLRFNEKKRNEEQQLQKKMEQNEMDELAVQRFYRYADGLSNEG